MRRRVALDTAGINTDYSTDLSTDLSTDVSTVEPMCESGLVCYFKFCLPVVYFFILVHLLDSGSLCRGSIDQGVD